MVTETKLAETQTRRLGCYASIEPFQTLNMSQQQGTRIRLNFGNTQNTYVKEPSFLDNTSVLV